MISMGDGCCPSRESKAGLGLRLRGRLVSEYLPSDHSVMLHSNVRAGEFPKISFLDTKKQLDHPRR